MLADLDEALDVDALQFALRRRDFDEAERLLAVAAERLPEVREPWWDDEDVEDGDPDVAAAEHDDRLADSLLDDISHHVAERRPEYAICLIDKYLVSTEGPAVIGPAIAQFAGEGEQVKVAEAVRRTIDRAAGSGGHARLQLKQRGLQR